MNAVTAYFKKSFAIAVFALMLLFTMVLGATITGFAWADATDASVEDIVTTATSEAVDIESNAGNLFATDDNGSTLTADKVERDFYWAGGSTLLPPIEAGGDIIAAGANITLNNSKAGGSVRIAGMNLTLENILATNNFTLAAQTINLANCEAGGGLYCAAQDITFSGKASSAVLTGGTVTINGTISGDVYVSADTIEIGPNAVINGTLYATGSSEPVIASSAYVEGMEYTTAGDEGLANAVEVVGAAAILMLVASKAIGVGGTLVFALILAWLFRRPVEDAAAMVRAHAGRVFATGIIAAIAVPVLAILLLVLVVTIPISFALLAGLVLLGIVALPFAAASFARLVFPRMNRIGAAALGGLILGIVAIIPFLGSLVSLAAFFDMVGYAVQAIWRSSRKAKGKDAVDGAPQAVPFDATPVNPQPVVPVSGVVEGPYEASDAAPVQSSPSVQPSQPDSFIPQAVDDSSNTGSNK